ncbi:MAG: FAD-binding oxidoreductase [Anaerolineales bacterium]|jgi:glycine/D-amino acid oxidase-like deaminating enzyme
MKTSAEVVICGAGIGGIATAYFLSVRHGIKDILLVDERAPLSLTSDKSTECYRNWWPGPGDAMVQMMTRGIDLLEEFAIESKNLFHLNRRGYLYATADPNRVAGLEGFAEEASSLGAGEIRCHPQGSSNTYRPAESVGFQDALGGADLITDRNLIQEHFPYLSPDVAGLLHVRRAGWLSAQQYGMYLFDQARANGIKFVSDKIVDVVIESGHISGIQLAGGEEIRTSTFIIAAGPLAAEVGKMLEIDIPVFNELHMKAAFNDGQGVIRRDAPLLIYTDEQELDWKEEERAALAEEEDTRWLTETLPSGAHVRPEGGLGAETIILLWDTREEEVEPILPPPIDPMYAEVTLRGLTKMIPGLEAYLERLPKPYIDGGYYTKTRENRPLACPLPVDGAYLIGAMSGFGIMSSAALGELTAAHITHTALPVYAPAFDLTRYLDPGYLALLENWGDNWQL